MTAALLFAFDEGYVDPGLVAMRTALDHVDSGVPAYLLGVGLRPKSVERIERTLSGRIKVIPVDDGLDGLPTGEVTSASWARVLAGSLLPAELDRVLYLDADVLVRGALDELFAMDLGGSVLAACPDFAWGYHGWRDAAFRAISDAPPAAGYFNSGVLVVDLSAWRAERVEPRVIECGRGVAGATRFADQDSLNAVLWDRWMPIDGSVWNYHGSQPDDRYAAARIVHFAGPNKPWKHPSSVARLQQEYEAASDRVGWDVSTPWHARVRWVVRNAMPGGVLAWHRARRRSAIARRRGVRVVPKPW